MISRRVFLKNGGFALVSLGFAPSFLVAHRVCRGGRRPKQLIAIFQRGAVDGLNVIVPLRRSARTTERGRASPFRGRTRQDGAIDLDGFFGFNPRLAAAQAALDSAQLGDRARVRIARRDALALRRAGLHGERHARREEHVATAGSTAISKLREARNRVDRSAPSRSRSSCRACCRARRRRWR